MLFLLIHAECYADLMPAVLQCVMKDKATGKLLALAEHGKAALASQDGKKPGTSQL